MNNDEQNPSDLVPFQTVQIIASALIAGPMIFAGIAYAIAQNKPPGDPILAYVAVVFTTGALVASLFAPAISTREQMNAIRAERPNDLVPRLYGVFQTRVVIRSALLEGVSLLSCVAYMSTAIWWTLPLALVGPLLMIILFPTRGRFDNWVREQRELISLES